MGKQSSKKETKNGILLLEFKKKEKTNKHLYGIKKLEKLKQIIFFIFFFSIFEKKIISCFFIFIFFFSFLLLLFFHKPKRKKKKKKGQRHIWCKVHNLLMVQQA